MKKLLTISIIVMLVLLTAVTGVQATTNDELPEKLYSMGSKYGMTKSDKVRIERYLADNPVTEEQADQIVAKVEEAIKVMEDAEKTNYAELTNAQKDKIKNIANEVASVLGLTLKFKTGNVEIYKNGKLIEVVTETNGKLAYTGNNVNTSIEVLLVAVVALVAVIVTKKKFANA